MKGRRGDGGAWEGEGAGGREGRETKSERKDVWKGGERGRDTNI